ncbi:MAG: alanine/glycine:cation symporter family protein [Clostridiaceae bacterium]|nr:alanine/glycine:cation symporter family protein [Clostridiaceae bacterium]
MIDLLISLRTLVWGMPTLLLMGSTGLFLTLRLRFLQARKLGTALRSALGNKNEKSVSGVTSRQALCTALAGTVGTGNIAGVAGALAIGGPGAVFWMWVAAFFGMATKFAEAVLAVRYRKKDDQGRWIGGPMWYIERGLGRSWRPLAKWFCLCGSLAAFGMGNITQINTAARAVHAAAAVAGAPPIPGAVLGLGLAAVIGTVLLGGAKRVGASAEQLVPLMSVLYLFGTLGVILTHLPALPAALGAIIRGAFHPAALGGGLAGVSFQAAMRAGVSRGVFSNEAGLGSAPIAYASADTDSPMRQGLSGVVEVFVDTILLCSLTALCILCSGVPIPYGGDAGSELLVSALGATFYGPLPSILTAVGLLLFALSSVLSWGLYGTRCIEYLLGGRAVPAYRLAYAACAIPAAIVTPAFAWVLADVLNGLMAVPNLLAVLLLSKEVQRIAKNAGFVHK